MFRISGIIAFQTKKSNLERDLRKENELQREFGKFLTLFLSLYHCPSYLKVSKR